LQKRASDYTNDITNLKKRHGSFHSERYRQLWLMAADRFKKSITSLRAFKGYVRSWIVMVIDFVARLRNMRRLASR